MFYSKVILFTLVSFYPLHGMELYREKIAAAKSKEPLSKKAWTLVKEIASSEWVVPISTGVLTYALLASRVEALKDWDAAVPVILFTAGTTLGIMRTETAQIAFLKVLFKLLGVRTQRPVGALLNHMSFRQVLLLAFPPENSVYQIAYENFLFTLTNEHFEHFRSEEQVLSDLFDSPRDFVESQKDFLISVCCYDLEHTSERIAILCNFFEIVRPQESLTFRAELGSFISSITPNALKKLRHPKVLEIARFYPQILQKEYDFLQEMGSVENALSLYYSVLAQEKELG